MARYTTESGLVVTDRRHTRTDWSDPRSWPPNPNVDPPPPNQPGVGPNVSEGFGNQHVMVPAVFNGQPIMPPPVMPWSGWPIEWSTPNWGGATGVEDIISRVSIVFGCVDLNSSILSSMPPYRLQGEVVVDRLPWMRNPQPEVYTSWEEALKQLVMSYWGVGEAFCWATSRYADGTVRTWVVLDPSWVEVEMDGQTRGYWLGRAGEGIEVTGDILHLRYVSWPGYPHGISALEAMANNLWGVQAMEEYQANLAWRGGIPWGVLTAPANLTADKAAEMRDNFVAARMSAQGAPAVLSGGVSLTPMTINPKEMALLELRQWDEARIATLLGVPPSLMGIPTGESLVYRNIEAIYDFHWRAYLRPHAAKIAEGLSQWALPSTQSIELNRDEYVRGSLTERTTAYTGLFGLVDELGRRAITIDEIRAAERLVAYDDADALDPEDNASTLAAIGAPQEAVWAAAGISDAKIADWKQAAPAAPAQTPVGTAATQQAAEQPPPTP
jgi:HK97 family phage portal protein